MENTQQNNQTLSHPLNGVGVAAVQIFTLRGHAYRKRTILERGFFLSKAMILQGKYVPEPVPVSMTSNTVSRELLEQKVVAMAWRNPQIISYKSNTYEMADCLA